jgi:hypothetical protein
MSLTWGESDVQYFRSMGIELSNEPAPEKAPGWVVVTAYCVLAFFSGFAWYVLLLAGKWALQHMGVTITGI